jgi:dephospho-CoA kinase
VTGRRQDGRRIGLTGDVGAGKSTVLGWLAQRGAATLDADGVVHRLLAEDAAVVEAVRARFGPRVFAGPRVDRGALGRIVFADAAALTDLEGILHPAVLAATAAWLAVAPERDRVVEAVKLIEGGMAAMVDEVWLVTAARAARAARLAARGWPPDEVARRMAAAPPLAPRLAVADVVVDNSGPWPATERQLAAAWLRCPPTREETSGAREG